MAWRLGDNAKWVLDGQMPGVQFIPMVELPRTGETVILEDPSGETLHTCTVTDVVWHFGFGHSSSIGVLKSTSWRTMAINWAAITDREVAAIEPEHADEFCWCSPTIECHEDGDVIIHNSLRSIVTGVSDEYWNTHEPRLN